MKGILQVIAFIGFWLVAIVLTAGIAVIALAIHLSLLFIGADKRAARALAKVEATLMDGEDTIVQDVQSRVFAFWSRRATIAITSSRILVLSRGLLGGFTMRDIQWKDLHDAQIEENVLSDLCGSNLDFKHLNATTPPILINGIENDVASKIYSRAQSEEQSWEEKRRVRGLEETRAASGGITLSSGGAGIGGDSGHGKSPSLLDELEQAKKLLDMGAISDSEFDEMKSKILARS